MRMLFGVLAATSALCVTASPARAQGADWESKWYWGAQGGSYVYQTRNAGGGADARSWAYDVGGHWLISKRRVGLYVAFDQLLFERDTLSAVPNSASTTGATEVRFTKGQRIQTSLYALPGPGAIQPYGGVGFAIHNITDAIPAEAFTSTQEQEIALLQIDSYSTKAFLVLTGGLQVRFGRLALFGTYQYMPAGQQFLIADEQHAFTGGLRYAFTRAQEEVGTR